MSVWLNRFAIFVACSTLFLLFAGGMVTSTGSGLAVPDWPLSYGMLFPPMVGGVFYEHGHRMVASTVGFLTIILCVWLWRKESRRWVQWTGTFALAAVISQGVLGGITVLFLLPTPVSVAHAGLAEIFFATTVAIALFTSKEWHRPPLGLLDAGKISYRTLSVLTAASIYIQILLGALMRHTQSGLAIPDFPLSFGRVIPPEFTPQIAIHFAHRVGAVAVLVMIVWLTLRTLAQLKNQKRFLRPVFLINGLLLFQILLGGLTIWTHKAPTIATLHLTIGATMLATAVVILFRAFRHLKAE